MSDSIFGSEAISRSTVWEAPRDVVKPKQVVRELSSPKDACFTAILEAPLQVGETTHFGFARKEAELVAAFAKLSVLESRALHARLSNPRSGDQLAAAFLRMTYERRARLINFLADARRREALKR
jgi:hypothetical protein